MTLENEKHLKMKDAEIKKLTDELLLMKVKISNLEENKANPEKIAQEAVKAEDDQDLEPEIEPERDCPIPQISVPGHVSHETTKTLAEPGLVPESQNYPELHEFEFITRKKGAYGPSKKKCLKYYSEK